MLPRETSTTLMEVSAGSESPFKLDFAGAPTFGRRMLIRAQPGIEKLLSFDQLNDIYSRVRGSRDVKSFLDRVLQDLGVRFHASADDLARIPRKGPVVIVANHPFGAIEGIVLAALLKSIRPDVKVMANHLLSRIPQLRDLFIYVDPFGTEASAADNIRPLRESLRWLKDGGLLAVFPAGEVAHLNWRTREVTDPRWSSTVGRIIIRTEAPVVPLFFSGHNGALFQLLGMVHPRLRTAMLPRELLNKRGAEIDVRIGSSIPFRKLPQGERELTDYLRHRTYLLQHRDNPSPADAVEKKLQPGGPKDACPVVPPVSPDSLAEEVARLPAGHLLAGVDDCVVYCAGAGQIPNVLREIGRLRELTYRAVGEGTGREIDLDEFDRWYTHLFVWNKAAREVVGAYRLGPTDEILPARGIAGLYTSTLFSYKAALLERMGPALELGRSFIRAEYQRSYVPLLLLWKGIGAFVVSRPRYKVLFGPVSISNEYRSVSRQLMVQFLNTHHGVPELTEVTRAKRPFKISDIPGCDADLIQRLFKETEDVSDFVAEIEPDQKGVPVLLRQYLKLGARFFSFNVDRDFNDAVDALMLVDLRQTEVKLLTRYMGKEGIRSFRRFHGLATEERRTTAKPQVPPAAKTQRHGAVEEMKAR